MTKRARILGLGSMLAVVLAPSATVTAQTTTRVVSAGHGSGQQAQSTPLSASAVPAGYLVVHSAFITAPGNGAFSGGIVNCPATSSGVARYPQGGGVVISSSSVLTIDNASAPDPDTPTAWNAQVANNSGVDTTFEVWAVCATRHRAYVQLSSAWTDIPQYTQIPVFLACPTGTKILGGGGWDTVNASMNSSYPVSNGWHVDANNPVGADQQVQVSAVCSKYSVATTGYGVHAGATVDNPPGSQTFAAAFCPSGQVPLSGGVLSSTSDTLVNINSTLPISGGWGVYENNASSFDTSITPYVICAA
jgi:hypothetical protein